MAHEKLALRLESGEEATESAVNVTSVELVSATDTSLTFSITVRAGSDPTVASGGSEAASELSAAIVAKASPLKPAIGGFRFHTAEDSLWATAGLGERVWTPAKVTSSDGKLCPLPASERSKDLAGGYVIPSRSRSQRTFEAVVCGLKPATAYCVRAWPLSPEESDEAESKGVITTSWAEPPLVWAQTLKEEPKPAAAEA
jgi:hypothetical protein